MESKSPIDLPPKNMMLFGLEKNDFVLTLHIPGMCAAAESYFAQAILLTSSFLSPILFRFTSLSRSPKWIIVRIISQRSD